MLQAVPAIVELEAHSLFGHASSYCKKKKVKLVKVMIIVVVMLARMIYIKVMKRS